MSWCDKLASTASVGLRFDYHFVSGDALLRALSPILDRLPVGEKTRFSITHHDSVGLTFSTDDGFEYGADPAKMFVGFKHRMKARAVSGGPPVMEMLSKPLPYTQLLPEVSSRVIEAAMLLPDVNKRNLKRIGVVATTLVADEDVPPGIERFVKYMGRPWDGSIEHFGFQLTAEVGEGKGWIDQCHHSIARPEDKDQLMTLNFDYQRIYSKPTTVSHESLKTLLDDVREDALEYFEDLAEGNRFDEDLIGKTASI